MNMTPEQAAQKYGDNKIMAVSADIVKQLIDHRCPTDLAVAELNSAMRPVFRRDAEFDTDMLQIIPYILVLGVPEDSDDLYVFTTHRVGGDNRLVGKYSIGTGGHIEEGETIGEAVARELMEEIGLPLSDIVDLSGNPSSFSFAATTEISMIYDASSEVNSVHAGLILACLVADMDAVHVTEPEKLSGEWVPVQDLFTRLDAAGLLEDWSHITLHRTFRIPEEHA